MLLEPGDDPDRHSVVNLDSVESVRSDAAGGPADRDERTRQICEPSRSPSPATAERGNPIAAQDSTLLKPVAMTLATAVCATQGSWS